MKLITAIVRPASVDAVKEALQGMNLPGFTVSEVLGHGRQKGHTEVYRGAEYTVDLLPKAEMKAAVPEDMVEKVIDAITTAARTGKIGDGKIFVTELSQAVRIRTGERGPDAL